MTEHQHRPVRIRVELEVDGRKASVDSTIGACQPVTSTAALVLTVLDAVEGAVSAEVCR